MHPKCVQKKDYLGYQIPYQTASNKRPYFPTASVILELEGKKLRIAVGVCEHLAEDMLMGRDISHFRQYLKKALDVEPGNNELDTPPTTIMSEIDERVINCEVDNDIELFSLLWKLESRFCVELEVLYFKLGVHEVLLGRFDGFQWWWW